MIIEQYPFTEERMPYDPNEIEISNCPGLKNFRKKQKNIELFVGNHPIFKNDFMIDKRR